MQAERDEAPGQRTTSVLVGIALSAIAVLSGGAALLFETLWFRTTSLTFGNGVWASSLVLAAFMAGLATGNLLAARVADRSQRPIRLYAGLELAIGLSGAALVFGLPSLTGWLTPLFQALRDTPWLLNGVRLTMAFLLLMIPATAMGATLPVLVRALSRGRTQFGGALGQIYGWNTAGAVLGALVGEAYWIEALGIRGTGLAAAGINGVAALAALGLAALVERPAVASSPATPRPPLSAGAWRLLAAAFLAGGVFLALEVVWFRFLWMFVYGTSVLFAALLAVVLVGISGGGLLASMWLRRGRAAAPLLPAIALGAGALVPGCYALFGGLFQVWTGSGATDGAEVSANAIIVQTSVLVVFSAPLMFPVAAISGLLFTGIGDAAKRELGGEARTTGLVTLANTTGAALGSVLGGFVLLPMFGIERSLLILGALYFAVAALSLGSDGAWRKGGRGVATAIVGGLALLAAVGFPRGALEEVYLPYRADPFLQEGAVIEAVHEGVLETIAYLRTDRFGSPHHRRLLTNGYSMSGNSTQGRRYMKAYVYLPVAVHPRLESALLISYGVGSTAKALTDTRSLETIDVVDISPDILETSAIVFPTPEENPLNDPRVRIHVEDGRFFLQTSGRRFDLITSEPPPPKVEGVVNLYTREYFQLVRDSLADGGITTYWLPVHTLTESDTKAILRAFCDVFDDCTLWTGSAYEWMMVGTRGLRGPVSEAHFRRQWEDPLVAAELDAVGIERPEQLGAMFLAGRRELDAMIGDTPPVADDFPLRLSNVPVQVGATERNPFFSRRMKVDRAQGAFRRSDFIRDTFPVAVRQASLPYFRLQRSINHALTYGRTAGLGDKELHQVLTRSSLRTLPLWMMGSDVLERRIVESLDDAATRSPEARGLRGLAAMADRDYAVAAGWFEQAERGHPEAAQVASYRVYAQCLAGNLKEAEALALELVRRSPEAAAQAGYWHWLARSFGIADPIQELAAELESDEPGAEPAASPEEAEPPSGE